MRPLGFFWRRIALMADIQTRKRGEEKYTDAEEDDRTRKYSKKGSPRKVNAVLVSSHSLLSRFHCEMRVVDIMLADAGWRLPSDLVAACILSTRSRCCQSCRCCRAAGAASAAAATTNCAGSLET
eukprot:542237-Rhodomonas_salina.2